MDAPLRIAARYRAGLFLKGSLLAALAVVLAVCAAAALGRDGWPLPVRVVVAALFVFFALLPVYASRLAFADAFGGRAERASGAVALDAKRRAWGTSLELPDGRQVEFLLVNPGPKLTPGARYTVTYGQRSRVLVALPELEA